MITKTTPAKTVDQYIESFPKEIQKILQAVRATIMKTAPGAEERISYTMPAYFLDGMLIYYAAWKEHIGIYPISTEMEKSINEIFKYSTSGKGTVRFPLDKPIPLDLIEKIVRFRIKEKEERKKLKK